MVKKNSPKCQRVKTLRKQNIEEIILFYLAFVFLTSISSIKKIIQETKVYCIWLDTIYNTFYQGYSFSLDTIQLTIPGVFIYLRHNTTLFTRGIHSPQTQYRIFYRIHSSQTKYNTLYQGFFLLRHNTTYFYRGIHSPQTEYNILYQGYSFSIDTIQHYLPGVFILLTPNTTHYTRGIHSLQTQYNILSRGIHSPQTQYNTIYQGYSFFSDTI